MSISYVENTAMMDEWTVSFDKVPLAADLENVVKRVKKAWEGVKGDIDGLGGLKLSKPDFDAIADALIKSGTHAVIFNMVLTKAEFKLDIETGKVTFNVGKVSVPSELEAYRAFLANLNGWSNNDKNIVPDGEFKTFNSKNPKAPPKPTSYKDFEEMLKKNVKSDLDAFRAWAKGNNNAKKAFDAIDKTAKAKPNDAARVDALKAINVSLKEYYKSF